MKKIKQWYETLFENYSRTYDNESFTQGTAGECSFIAQELNHNKSLKILDVGCGTGRHSIVLTKKGYPVTGVDLSESQLALAREKADKEDLKISFLKHDARNLPFEKDLEMLVIAEK